jgi:UDP-N-acetylglucosamine--N-acetylmuramyl-(pentapeptide) pyrophosphoryl-undecaprenol N-acetylglucosamine transferase
MKIVFTGGGTAGHIFPIIAIVRELRNIYPGENLKIYYAGPKHSYGEVLLSQESVIIKNIVCGKIRRYFSFKNIIDIFKVPVGIVQSLWFLFFCAPDVVFSTGGYGSLPMAIAALVLRVPFLLQELDAVPGLVSKVTSKWALEIFTAFPDTTHFPKNKSIFVGNPIRLSLLNGDINTAAITFALRQNKPLLLVLGGSQGSQTINQLILDLLPELIADFEIIHQTGLAHQKETQLQAKAMLDEEKQRYYHCFAFLNEAQLSHALKACDLVISRAGSGAIFEIAANAKPMILIPLMGSAQDHQVKNAYKVAEYGAALVIEEQNLKPHLFLQKLHSLFAQPEILRTMSQNALRFSRPKATTIIANYLHEYLT